MPLYPEVQLSVMRQIGWDAWDPMGIRMPGTDDWQTAAASEYDRYLSHVVGMLNDGHSAKEAIAYLDWVGSDHMGLGPTTAGAHAASTATVSAILAYLETLPDGPPNVR